MAFLVNSSPGAGLRFEPSTTFDDAGAALSWAVELERRGMRLIRIRDMVSGRVFKESEFRAEIKRMEQAS